MSDLNYTQITVLEVLSRNLRFRKKKIETKDKQDLEFRHSNLEMFFRVIQKFMSNGRLSGLVFVISCSEYATFA